MRRQPGAADSLVHHGQAVVRERLIVHLSPHEKAAADAPQRRLVRDNDDLQKVMQTVRRNS